MILELKCVLHIGIDKFKEKIIAFTSDTLQNCHFKREIRQKATKKSKFDVINLPDTPDGISGYHPSCYRCYCAISIKKDTKNSQRKCMNTLFYHNILNLKYFYYMTISILLFSILSCTK